MGILIAQQGQIYLSTKAEFPWETQNNILIILLWVLLNRLTTKVLPQEFTWPITSMTSTIGGKTYMIGGITIIIIIQNIISSIVTFI